ncbi:kinesin-like protein KIN-14N [Camellia sinensis]|uniref:kinesin-like protein KIN-14N n=1 Tax=Camellia sinensis TaxID=4442 RepID=UPI001036E815|nr:kinesin-like protein KIN-14N [Camellia sinensis]
MVGPTNGSRTRQAFSVVNGGQDLAPANGLASNVGSDCGSVEFTREEVEGLLNEKMKTKNEFNLKEKFDQMMKYIKRLRLCIKWLQEFEGSYLLEQEKLRNLLEMAEKKCSDMEMLIKAKEEELNSIIIELRKTYSSLQEKFMKEESGRLIAFAWAIMDVYEEHLFCIWKTFILEQSFVLEIQCFFFMYYLI